MFRDSPGFFVAMGIISLITNKPFPRPSLIFLTFNFSFHIVLYLKMLTECIGMKYKLILFFKFCFPIFLAAFPFSFLLARAFRGPGSVPFF